MVKKASLLILYVCLFQFYPVASFHHATVKQLTLDELDEETKERERRANKEPLFKL
jgi:hypothetical protein